MQRLDKLLSDAGIASRRGVRELIRAGRVRVNGEAAARPDLAVDDADEVAVDGAAVERDARIVLMLHKPAGCVTSTDDPRDATVMELLPEKYRRRSLRPVGRLDKETEGLLLLTNDGMLAHRLISPKHGAEKVYYAEHTGEAGPEDVRAFAAGLVLRDGTVCLPAKLEPLGPGRSRVTVREGKYHQVRRMMAARGMRVDYLRREAEAGLTLGDLPGGSCRELTEAELRLLDDSATCTTQNKAETD